MDERLEQALRIEETNPDKALSLCSDVLNEDNAHGEATLIAARVMMTAGRCGLAHILFRRCNELSPHKAPIQNSLGLSIEYTDTAGALKYYENALRIDPNHAHAMNNKGLMLLKNGRPDLCLKYANKCLEANPQFTSAHINRATALLMLRRWKEGWEAYRSSVGISRDLRNYHVPEWNGEKGTVVVYGEQGVGDEILYASCIPDLLKTNKVIIDCDPRLTGLFKRSFPDCRVYGSRFSTKSPILHKDNAQPDYQITIGGLPRFFRNTDESFPGTAYLKADPERRIQWRALFDSLPFGSHNPVMRRNQCSGKRIGIAWQGGVINTERHLRSFDLDTFAPLFDLPHTFISLEYDEPDLKGYPVRHFGRAVNKGVDYDETMALIAELDLVICVTTTAVHAAGALGVECWCLTPKYPSYRFHLDGNIPWHNSVELVRQTDTWENVITEVKRKLEQKWTKKPLSGLSQIASTQAANQN